MNDTNALITGGAGFIGSNLASRLIRQGCRVTIFDNLSRRGSKVNIRWLRDLYGHNSFRLIQASLSNCEALYFAARGADRIYHLAGQVAVTKSVENPRADFEANAIGTFNVLEAARCYANDPILIYASTNKVYGNMESAEIVEEEKRYRYASLPLGVPETQPIDFHSPYGCSKGAGDQYTRDYNRIYGLRAVVVRQSCIYGYRQLGVEDQGWMAWFTAAAIKGLPVHICGNGKQVRDVLFVEDLLDAYELMIENIDRTAGEIYNIGGGPKNTVSVWTEFGSLLAERIGHQVQVSFGDWRPGDQMIYVSDVRKAMRDFGWRPKVSILEGSALLYNWIRENHVLFDFLWESKGMRTDVKSSARRIQSATA
jgi:CDP-paratose 2-epimerase